MQHGVHRTGDFDVLRDVLLRELESRMRQQMRNIRIGAGNEDVQAKDVPALLDKIVAEVRSEKARPACDDCAQSRSLAA